MSAGPVLIAPHGLLSEAHLGAFTRAGAAVIRCADLCPAHTPTHEQFLLLDALADTLATRATPALVVLTSELDAHAADVAFWMNRDAAHPARMLSRAPDQSLAGTDRSAFFEALAREPFSLPLVPREPDPPRIETDRLLLTIGSPAQIEGYYHAIVGTSMFDNLLWEGPSSVNDLLSWRWRSLRNFAKGPACDANFGIIEQASGRQIGGCSWRPKASDPTLGDIGYTLAPAFHRRGYGCEAIGALVDWIFRERRAARVEATVFVGNHASRGLLEKLGFTHEGIARARILKRGRRIDEWCFAVLPGELKTHRGAPSRVPPRSA